MKKILIFGLVILLGLIVSAFIYLNYVYIPNQLKPMVVKLLEDNLDKKVNIAKASYFPIKGVLFSDVEILNKDNSLFLKAAAVDFGLKSIPAIKKNAFSAKLKLVINGLVFKQAELEAGGDCKVDLDLNIKSKDDIAFAAIVELKDLSVKGIEQTGEITKIRGRIICSQSSFSSEKLSADIGGQMIEVLFKGDYDASDIVINKFDIDYADTNVSLKGKVSNPANPNVDFKLQALIKLKDIPSILSGLPLPSLAGDCKITADFKGAALEIGALKADAKIIINKASVDKIKIADLKADIDLENGDLNLSSLDCDFYNGKITGAAPVRGRHHIADSGLDNGVVPNDRPQRKPSPEKHL